MPGPREEILIARIETVTSNFENIHDKIKLRGCADDDDIVRNIRNLQAACPGLQEASIISIKSLTHIEECLGLLGVAFTAALVQPRVERMITILNMLSPATGTSGGIDTTGSVPASLAAAPPTTARRSTSGARTTALVYTLTANSGGQDVKVVTRSYRNSNPG